MGHNDEYIVKNEIDLIKAANELENILSEECSCYELLGDKTAERVSWFFSLKEDDLVGFIDLESNTDTIGEPTITIALKICDATQFSRDDLFNVLNVNGDLWRATYTISKVEDNLEFLFIQYRTLLSSFRKDDFVNCVNHLVDQCQSTLGSDTDDESNEYEEEKA